MRGTMLAAALLAAAGPLPGRALDRGPIQDNSFLVEEAYNQEPGVIQHISTFARGAGSAGWQYTFTEEWPIQGLAHQASVTLPWQRAPGQPAGLGDVALHYRWQAVGDGSAPAACAPRLSLLFPSGDARRGRGHGTVGAQAAVPLSVVLGSRLVTHVNAGVTWERAAPVAPGRAPLWGYSFGQSLVWLAHPSLNLLAEVVYAEALARAAAGTLRQASLTVNPGLRAAVDGPGGLQVVGGLSLPVGAGPSRGERGVFLYLSFEHPAFGAGGG